MITYQKPSKSSPKPYSIGGACMSEEAELATRRLKLKLALEDLREMKGSGTE